MKYVKKIRETISWRDSLVFLFFLLVSSALWFIRTLRKDLEAEVKIPLEYVNMPKGYIQTLELPEYLSVRFSDRGTSVLAMLLGRRFAPLSVDLREYVHKRTMLTSALSSDVQKRLNPTSDIRGYYPDSIHFRILKLEEKCVPVKFTGSVELERQYMMCDSMEITPSKVMVYAPKEVLDTVTFAPTEGAVFKGVKDTLVEKIRMAEIPGLSYSHDELDLVVRTEPYTEKRVEAPICVENLPEGLTLRLFPPYVDLSFYVGVSCYDKVDASSFSIVVDYKDVLASKKNKLKVKLNYTPKGTFHLNMKPEAVEFLVEAKP